MGIENRAQAGANKVERRGLMDALDASQSLVWFDAHGNIVDANENALRLFSFGASEVVQQDYRTLCGNNPKQALADKREWNRIASGEMCHNERSFKSKDGREIWSSVNFAAVLNADGSTRRVVAIFIDMSRFAWKPNDVRRAGY